MNCLFAAHRPHVLCGLCDFCHCEHCLLSCQSWACKAKSTDDKARKRFLPLRIPGDWGSQAAVCHHMPSLWSLELCIQKPCPSFSPSYHPPPLALKWRTVWLCSPWGFGGWESLMTVLSHAWGLRPCVVTVCSQGTRSILLICAWENEGRKRFCCF